MEDVKAIVNKIVDKAKSDPDFMKKLNDDPEKAIESVAGIDIPDGMLDKVVAAVKTKEFSDKAGDILKNLISK